MSYTKLFFNSVSLETLSDKVEFKPNFICPACKKPVDTPKTSLSVLPAQTLDFNNLVTFTMPCCGAKISLYVAVHKDEKGTQICIQRSDREGVNGIPSDWWVRSIGA